MGRQQEQYGAEPEYHILMPVSQTTPNAYLLLVTALLYISLTSHYHCCVSVSSTLTTNLNSEVLTSPRTLALLKSPTARPYRHVIVHTPPPPVPRMQGKDKFLF